MRIVKQKKTLNMKAEKEHGIIVSKRDSKDKIKQEASIYFFVFSLSEKKSFNLAKNDRRFLRVLPELNLDEESTGGLVEMDETPFTFVSLFSPGVDDIDEEVTTEVP